MYPYRNHTAESICSPLIPQHRQHGAHSTMFHTLNLSKILLKLKAEMCTSYYFHDLGEKSDKIKLNKKGFVLTPCLMCYLTQSIVAGKA